MGFEEEKIADEIDFGGVTATYEDAIRFLHREYEAMADDIKGKACPIAVSFAMVDIASKKMASMAKAVEFVYGKTSGQVLNDLKALVKPGEVR